MLTNLLTLLRVLLCSLCSALREGEKNALKRQNDLFHFYVTNQVDQAIQTIQPGKISSFFEPQNVN